MNKFLNSKYWEEKDITTFSAIIGLIPLVIVSNIANYIDLVIIYIIAVPIAIISFFIVLVISHIVSNTILDIILDRINNMGEKKVIVKIGGVILIVLDLLIFIAIILWSIYEAFNTGEYIVLIIIPIYWFLYYFILSSPIGSTGDWLFNNIKINSDKKDLKGEV